MTEISLILYNIIGLTLVIAALISKDISRHISIYSLSVVCSDFFKRFIYYDGNADSFVYYFVILLPDLILFAIILSSRFSFHKKSFFYLIAFFAVFLPFSFLNAPPFNVLVAVRTTYLLLIFLVMPDSYYSISKKDMQQMVMVFIFLGILSTGYGSIQFFDDYTVWERNWDTFSPSSTNLYALSNFGKLNRAFSFYSEVATHATALAFSILLTVFLAPKGLIKWLVFLILCFGLALTGSKGMIVALLVSFPLFLLRMKIAPRILTVILFLPFVLMCTVLTTATMTSFAGSLKATTGQFFRFINPITFNTRIRVVNDFLGNMLSRKTGFLFGEGMNYQSGVVVDNIFLYLVGQIGFVGLLLFIYLLYDTFRKYRLIEEEGKQNDIERRILRFSLYFIIVSLLFSFTSLALITHTGLSLFLFCIAYIQAVYRIRLKTAVSDKTAVLNE